MLCFWIYIHIGPLCLSSQKTVIRRITAICKNFLWDGRAIYNRSPPVSWESMCRKKDKGGLGIRDCETWNVAAIGKLVWDLAWKVDKLWVRWVDHIYLRGQHWWSYSPGDDISWGWHKVCKVRYMFESAYVNSTWLHSKNGMYSMKSGYCWLKRSAPRSNGIGGFGKILTSQSIASFVGW